MEFTVQNNNFLYSVSFTEEIAWIGLRDFSNGLNESLISLPLTVWQIVEHQRQQFNTYNQGQVPITENQFLTHAMGQEVASFSGHHYPHVNGSDFPANYPAENIQYTFPWQEGQIPNSWFTSQEVGEASCSEAENNLHQIISRAHSREQSELSIDNSNTTSFNDLENFDPAQYYGSTDMSTTPSMTTPSIEEGTAHNPIFLSDVPNTPVTVQPTQLPGRNERQKGFGNEIQNLPEYVIVTLFA